LSKVKLPDQIAIVPLEYLLNETSIVVLFKLQRRGVMIKDDQMLSNITGTLNQTLLKALLLNQVVVTNFTLDIVPARLDILEYDELLSQPTTYINALCILVLVICVLKVYLNKKENSETSFFLSIISCSLIFTTAGYYLSIGTVKPSHCALQIVLLVISVFVLNR
jgi:hypothetical protein